MREPRGRHERPGLEAGVEKAGMVNFDLVRAGPLWLTAHFSFDFRGLSVEGAPPIAEWWEAGFRLYRFAQGVQFAVGDWFLWGEETYPEEELYQFLEEKTGWAYETLRNFVWVSSRVSPSIRRLTDLSWGHYQTVAALAPAEQAEWLSRAASEGWTREQLRGAVRPEPETLRAFRRVYLAVRRLLEEHDTGVVRAFVLGCCDLGTTWEELERRLEG